MEMFCFSFSSSASGSVGNFLGRVLLCDAAHVHSPAGSGDEQIQDAVSLAEPLCKAVEAGEVSGLGQWSKTPSDC